MFLVYIGLAQVVPGLLLVYSQHVEIEDPLANLEMFTEIFPNTEAQTWVICLFLLLSQVLKIL